MNERRNSLGNCRKFRPLLAKWNGQTWALLNWRAAWAMDPVWCTYPNRLRIHHKSSWVHWSWSIPWVLRRFPFPFGCTAPCLGPRPGSTFWVCSIHCIPTRSRRRRRVKMKMLHRHHSPANKWNLLLVVCKLDLVQAEHQLSVAIIEVFRRLMHALGGGQKLFGLLRVRLAYAIHAPLDGVQHDGKVLFGQVLGASLRVRFNDFDVFKLALAIVAQLGVSGREWAAHVAVATHAAKDCVHTRFGLFVAWQLKNGRRRRRRWMRSFRWFRLACTGHEGK